MKSTKELTAAMLLNAFNTARLSYNLKGRPEPETSLEDTIEAWQFLVARLEAETTTED